MCGKSIGRGDTLCFCLMLVVPVGMNKKFSCSCMILFFFFEREIVLMGFKLVRAGSSDRSCVDVGVGVVMK
jgi:hypothetical protein